MFQEGDQGGGNAHELVWRHIHVLDILHRDLSSFTLYSYCCLLPHEPPSLIQGCIGLGNRIVLFVKGGQIFNIFACPPIFHLPVRCLDKPEFIYPRIGAQGYDQPDIRAFRRLYGANPAIMGRMDISDLKTGPFSC